MKATAKDKLGKALIRLMKKKKVEDIRARELIQEAGVNPSSYYYNFETIDDVADYLIVLFADDLLKILLSMDHKKAYPTFDMYRYFFEHRDIYTTLRNSVYKLRFHQKIKETFAQTMRPCVVVFKNEKGEPYILDDQDFKMYVEIISRQQMVMIDFWADNLFVMRPEEIVQLDHNVYSLNSAFFRLKREDDPVKAYPVKSLKNNYLPEKSDETV